MTEIQFSHDPGHEKGLDAQRVSPEISVSVREGAVQVRAFSGVEAAALPPDYDVTHHRSRGPLESAVATRVRSYEPNLVVMTLHGHDELSDIVFSSHTARVLDQCRLPLRWVPA